MKLHPPGHVTQIRTIILHLKSTGKLDLNLRGKKGAGAMGEGTENEVSTTGEKPDVDVAFEPSIPKQHLPLIAVMSQ